MEKNRSVIRELLKFEFELGHSAKQAMDNINRAKGAGTVAYSTAKEWSPREVDREAVVNAVEEHPSMTTRMLAEDFECSHMQINRILHDAGKKWLKSQWVPKSSQQPKNKNAWKLRPDC
ncbi:histone-lysine N-methyltransferase SETMAR [Ditylenchus destructor]|uniref:Histone-lysine N-methyltransferase SETMAR n=1 Tax=Ditylenchus destructor TaxID=166010 RepID=A0AAD4QXN8_9BILA|nr:histone-lysine N-methyltransferase SETMAR [Ditylenchus destructor]